MANMFRRSGSKHAAPAGKGTKTSQMSFPTHGIQHPHHPMRPQPSLRTGVCILVGLAIGLNLEMIGRITGTELFFLFLLPFLVIIRSMPPLSLTIRRLLFLSLVWFCAQLVSDLINHTSFDNTVRGMARAMITGVLLLGYYSLGLDNRKRLIILFAANAIGLLIGYLLEPSELAFADPWKFGYGRTVSMLAVVAAGMLWSARLPLLAVGLCLVTVAVNLALGFRSMAGIVFMVALGIAMVPFLERWFKDGSKLKALLVSIMLIGGAGMIVEVYEYTASEGIWGEDAKFKLSAQTESYGLLLSGRAEVFVSSLAILDRPIFGHGSWATSDYYYDLFMEHLGYGQASLPDTPNPIPTHSFLFGAWTEGGIFSAFIWLYVLGLLARVFIKLVWQPELVHPVPLFCLFDLSWNIFFSPYGLDGRVNACFEIIVLTMLLSARLPSTQPSPRSRPSVNPAVA